MTACGNLEVGMDVAYKEMPFRNIGHIREFERIPGCAIQAHVLAPGSLHSASIMSVDWLTPWIEPPVRDGRDRSLESSCL